MTAYGSDCAALQTDGVGEAVRLPIPSSKTQLEAPKPCDPGTRCIPTAIHRLTSEISSCSTSAGYGQPMASAVLADLGGDI